jgi:hypothetical protein
METPEYPPNSFSSKKAPEPREKNIERVTRSEPIRRKKSLGRKFKDVFFGGDAKSAGRYVLYGVLIPEAKNLIIESVREGIEKLVRGESYRRRNAPFSGPRGYVSYNRTPMQQDPRQRDEPRPMSARARSRHDFDEIVLQSRPEAEEVIERMFDIVGRYDTATVADLYDLVGVRSSHVDHKWGWSDMRGAGVVRVRDGYLLELPDVQPMEM